MYIHTRSELLSAIDVTALEVTVVLIDNLESACRPALVAEVLRRMATRDPVIPVQLVRLRPALLDPLLALLAGDPGHASLLIPLLEEGDLQLRPANLLPLAELIAAAPNPALLGAILRAVANCPLLGVSALLRALLSHLSPPMVDSLAVALAALPPLGSGDMPSPDLIARLPPECVYRLLRLYSGPLPVSLRAPLLAALTVALRASYRAAAWLWTLKSLLLLERPALTALFPLLTGTPPRLALLTILELAAPPAGFTLHEELRAVEHFREGFDLLGRESPAPAALQEAYARMWSDKAPAPVEELRRKGAPPRPRAAAPRPSLEPPRPTLDELPAPETQQTYLHLLEDKLRRSSIDRLFA